MKKPLFAATIAVLGLASCASQRSLVSDPPFQISEARVQDWVGGREESGMGTRLTMRWTPQEPASYTADTLYFRGRALVPVVVDTETGMRLQAEYQRLQGKGDMIMSSDSLQEVGNQPPLPLEQLDPIPFELERDEAVLRYTRRSDGKPFYYKFGGIKEIPARTYPSRPQN